MALPSVWTNPKFIRLAKDLGEPLAHVVGHLVCLWETAYQHYLPDGIMPRAEVEIAAQWEGKPKLFVKKAVLRKTLVAMGRNVQINHFLQYAPEYVQKRAERLRLQRPMPETTGDKRGTNGGQTANIGGQKPPSLDPPLPSHPIPSSSETQKSKDTSSADDVQSVFDHYKRTWPPARSYALTPARRLKIRSRLAEFSVADLCLAIDNSRKDTWEGREKFHDLLLLFRSVETVEKWLNFAPEAGKKTRNEHYDFVLEKWVPGPDPNQWHQDSAGKVVNQEGKTGEQLRAERLQNPSAKS